MMKWLIVLCLLAVHQINAMPSLDENEPHDSFEEWAPESNEEIQEEKVNIRAKRQDPGAETVPETVPETPVDGGAVEPQPVDGIMPISAYGPEAGGSGMSGMSEGGEHAGHHGGDKGGMGGDGGSGENLDLDVNVNVNAPQKDFKADVDVNVNINAAEGCKHPKCKCKCSSGWILFEKSCYFFSTDSNSWTGAQQKCNSMGSSLVTITTDAEFYFLQGSLTQEAWTGMTDEAVEGDYRWISDNSVHVPSMHVAWWLAGEPNISPSEDYIHFMFVGQYLLHDYLESHNIPYICEKPATKCAH